MRDEEKSFKHMMVRTQIFIALHSILIILHTMAWSGVLGNIVEFFRKIFL